MILSVTKMVVFGTRNRRETTATIVWAEVIMATVTMIVQTIIMMEISGVQKTVN
jgi:hypothetical protein